MTCCGVTRAGRKCTLTTNSALKEAEPLRQHSRPPQLEQHHEQAGTAGPEELDDDEIEEVEDGL